MPLPEASQFQFTSDLKICRVLNGMWQVSGAHGGIDRRKAIAAMFDYIDAGFTTWDLADHYGPAEDFMGEFRKQLINDRGEDAVSQIQAFTKWVPRPGRMTQKIVEDNINISLRRMGVETLDLVQFHWWDYQDKNYLEALKHMTDLQQEGKIKHLALTNFDTDHLETIVNSGIKIISNQVQFSIIDQRPSSRMAKFCEKNNIHLLAYGTAAGGLLSERFLKMPEPGNSGLTTASLRKYKNMITRWGNWNLFQQLLEILEQIAKKYGVSLTNVAVRYVLERPTVAGAIVGARLGVSEHIADNARVFGFALDEEDYRRIAEVTSRSRDLHKVIGDCGDEYRG
ncbi:MAG: aldo/keto reductase [Myxacorys californica WJT36-NPBG1]|jgi:aryl-alcohol dehydrogenase-like predicted oxidoreductase|nr:aldo/keto reductase [Myxacorys californica WJT36-NPBG1]